MFTEFKVGDYALYRSKAHKYWFVFKICSKSEPMYGDHPYYYKYKVIKSSNPNTHYSEDVNSVSSFMYKSMFHDQCIRVKSIDDSTILAMVL